MKEKILVLAKATLTLSKKYQELVCIAGLTGKGEWRRIYPIKWESFWHTSRRRFEKKQWIEYETQSDKPADHRQESRKIKEETIIPLNKAKFSEIKELISDKITTLEDLQSKGVKENSLGIIKPRIIDFVEEKSNLYDKAEFMKGQKHSLEKKPLDCKYHKSNTVMSFIAPIIAKQNINYYAKIGRLQSFIGTAKN